eukprot:2643232-Amphidinium_carterae.1
MTLEFGFRRIICTFVLYAALRHCEIHVPLRELQKGSADVSRQLQMCLDEKLLYAAQTSPLQGLSFNCLFTFSYCAAPKCESALRVVEHWIQEKRCLFGCFPRLVLRSFSVAALSAKGGEHDHVVRAEFVCCSFTLGEGAGSLRAHHQLVMKLQEVSCR